MSNEFDWLEKEQSGHDTKINDLAAAETDKKKAIKKGRPGTKGKPPVKSLQIELQKRMGKRAPLVMVYGQGPRKNVKNVNVPIPADLAAKLDKYTIGPKAQVIALLAAHALESLESNEQCISATSMK